MMVHTICVCITFLDTIMGLRSCGLLNMLHYGLLIFLYGIPPVLQFIFIKSKHVGIGIAFSTIIFDFIMAICKIYHPLLLNCTITA